MWFLTHHLEDGGGEDAGAGKYAKRQLFPDCSPPTLHLILLTNIKWHLPSISHHAEPYPENG